MIPSDATPARRAARREIALHRLLCDLAAEQRTTAFVACREALVRASARRHALAVIEHRDARRRAA